MEMDDPEEQVATVAGDPGATSTDNVESQSMLAGIISEIIYSPLNLGLVAIIAYLVYKIIKDRMEVPHSVNKPQEPELPKLRRDFTVQELKAFDGNQPDGRVLVAVNGSVYDVTKGKKFYGPGGPYAAFAGRDASRNLAKFSVVANDSEEYDDLQDLNTMEMDSVKEWEMQFKEKYILVGRLLKKGEQPTNYSDEEEDPAAEATETAETTETDDVKNTVRKRPTETSSHEEVN